VLAGAPTDSIEVFAAMHYLMGMTQQDENAAFGFRQVPKAEKQGLVNEVFSKAAGRYDQMNDLMSSGLHRLWKDDMITMLNPPKNDRIFNALDVAGGTGDIAFRILDASGVNTRVTVADISPEMVSEGQMRGASENRLARCSFTVGNAESLAFPTRVLTPTPSPLAFAMSPILIGRWSKLTAY
jgi:demethylmenaquinone methyltransferase / 2-methoxy-6-polyprenyl-1,4-benzoquinol methylase